MTKREITVCNECGEPNAVEYKVTCAAFSYYTDLCHAHASPLRRLRKKGTDTSQRRTANMLDRLPLKE